MKVFAFYILLAFLGIAVFGFSGLMSHDSLFSQCVNAMIPGGMPCHNIVQDLGINVMHAQIFQSFSSASMVLAFLLMLVFAAIVFSTNQEQKIFFAQIAIANNFASVSKSQLKFQSWLKHIQQHPNHVI